MKGVRSGIAARFWAATAILVGITFVSVGYIDGQNKVPLQDKSVIPAVSQSTAITKQIAYPTYFSRPQIDSKIGTISFPSLNLSWPIFEGTEEEQLSKGVGHYRGSVLPGMRDNSILSGHRTTVFKRLGELESDDLIFVKTSAGLFTYQVSTFEIVDRSNNDVINPTPEPVLTLTTCYPFDVIGRTTEAFIVSAKLVDSELY
jgi:sortase A